MEAEHHPEGQRVDQTEWGDRSGAKGCTELGQGEQHQPDHRSDDQAGEGARGMTAAPEHGAEEGRRQLGEGCEGNQTDGGQAGGSVDSLKREPGQKQDHADDDATDLKDGVGHVGRVFPRPPPVPGQ